VARATGRVTYTLDAFSRAWQRNENGSIITYSYRGTGETLAKSVLGSTPTKYALTQGGSPLGQKVGTAAASLDIPTSYLSFGERMTVVVVEKAADACEIVVTSRGRRSSLIDFGKNRRNVARVVEALSRQRGERT
jgi:hypothetical protein